jgi:hypothetical protein
MVRASRTIPSGHVCTHHPQQFSLEKSTSFIKAYLRPLRFTIMTLT